MLSRVPSLDVLDRVAYRIHAFAFPVWTFAVLITGPIWAHQAWSSYWNWDPKEVWAFITWVVYAAYLHARTTAGWKGRNAAILALVGTATLWFNFIGINYFSSSTQHSYADAAPAPVVLGSVLEVVLRRVAVGEVLGLLRLGLELLVDLGRVDVLLVGQRLGLVVDGFVVRVRCGPGCGGHAGPVPAPARRCNSRFVPLRWPTRCGDHDGRLHAGRPAHTEPIAPGSSVSRDRPMTIRWIWLVPSKICITLASRM